MCLEVLLQNGARHHQAERGSIPLELPIAMRLFGIAMCSLQWGLIHGERGSSPSPAVLRAVHLQPQSGVWNLGVLGWNLLPSVKVWNCGPRAALGHLQRGTEERLDGLCEYNYSQTIREGNSPDLLAQLFPEKCDYQSVTELLWILQLEGQWGWAQPHQWGEVFRTALQ